MSKKFHQGVLTIIIMGVKLICRRTIKYVAFRASSYEPGWPGWLGYRGEFCLGFIWEILDRFPRWEKVKDPGDEFWCQIQEQSKHGETQNFNFRAYLNIGNSESCITAVKWDAYDVENTGGKKDDAIWTARIHPAVHPVNRDEVFIWQNFQISGTKPARPLIWTHQNFYKGFRGEARSRKQGQPGQPGSCEKALRPEKVSIHVHPWQWSIVRDYRSSSQCLIIVLNSKTEPLFLEFKWCKDKFKLLNKRLQVG